MEKNIVSWREPLGRKECPYAFRWVFNLGLFAFRIHRWIGSDDDRAMHDHPYWMLIIVLKGRYNDMTPNGVELMKPGTIRFRKAKHIHTVQLCSKECWTFLITGPPLRKWGFWLNGKWKRAEEYFKRNGHHQCES